MEIKPCPFCGNDAKIVQTGYGTESPNSAKLSFRIECVKCSATAPEASGYISINLSNSGRLNIWHDDRESAIEAWNRRASDDERRSDSKS